MRTPLLAVLLCIVVGAAVGVGGYTFVYAEGASYLVDDPKACANCHVMEEQYSAWMKSSHRAVTTCNSCHTPHETLPKYFTKALNGYYHSLAFTTGNFPTPIRITERNRRITEAACRTCHQSVTAAMAGLPAAAADAHAADAHEADAAPSCIRCHQDVGHWTH